MSPTSLHSSGKRPYRQKTQENNSTECHKIWPMRCLPRKPRDERANDCSGHSNLGLRRNTKGHAMSLLWQDVSNGTLTASTKSTYKNSLVTQHFRHLQVYLHLQQSGKCIEYGIQQITCTHHPFHFAATHHLGNTRYHPCAVTTLSEWEEMR